MQAIWWHDQVNLIERIHILWVEAVKAVGPNVHHRDVVSAALDSLEAELNGNRAHAVERFRKQLKP